MTKRNRRTLIETVRDFISAKGANVAIIFGLSLIPLVGLIGIGTDYGVGLANKSKIDNAADAAALAAVATAKAFVAANPNDTSVADPVFAGLTQASNTFKVNFGTVPFTVFPIVSQIAGFASSPPSCGAFTACIYLFRTNQTFISTVVYNVTTQNHFGQLFGNPTMNISGTAVATADVPSYLDFYLLMDVSGSMGLPSTSSGQSALAAVNNDMYSDYQQGCQFACHFPGYSGWNLAVQNNIQLRSGAVNSAVCSLIARASNPSVANQYRIGLYPFVNQMATLTALTTNMTTLSNAAQCSASNPMTLTNLLDTGTTQLYTGNDPSTGTGAGGTHFEVVFPQLQSTITSFGTGASSATSKPFVFLITDGMENAQHYYTWSNGKYTYPGSPSTFSGYASAAWDGSQSAVMDPTTCTAIKNAGATVSILYIPYLLISFTPNGGGISYENTKVNGFSPNIPTALQSCATPGYFYTANSPTDITNALNAMFQQAVQVAHLKQ